MSTGHDHAPQGTHRGKLAIAFGITATILVAELIGAWWTNSLALLVDAGHMLTDASGLLMALIAAKISVQAPRTITRVFMLFADERSKKPAQTLTRRYTPRSFSNSPGKNARNGAGASFAASV